MQTARSYEFDDRSMGRDGARQPASRLGAQPRASHRCIGNARTPWATGQPAFRVVAQRGRTLASSRSGLTLRERAHRWLERRRQLRVPATVEKADMRRITESLPFDC